MVIINRMIDMDKVFGGKKTDGEIQKKFGSGYFFLFMIIPNRFFSTTWHKFEIMCGKTADLG